MKINELISKLARISTEQGNIEVVMDADGDIIATKNAVFDKGENAAVIG